MTNKISNTLDVLCLCDFLKVTTSAVEAVTSSVLKPGKSTTTIHLVTVAGTNCHNEL